MLTGGWPDLGLLVLRSALAFALLAQTPLPTASALQEVSPLRLSILAAAGLALLILAGFLTRIAGLVAAAGFCWSAAGNDAALPGLIDGCLVALAVALLGPGGFSLDALLFGRREIIIPERSSSPDA